VGDVSRGFVAVNGDLRSGYAGWTGQNSPLFSDCGWLMLK